MQANLKIIGNQRDEALAKAVVTRESERRFRRDRGWRRHAVLSRSDV
jgi:hypothetical protein